MQKFKENNDRVLEDPFETAKKLKEVRSGRLSLDYDKRIEDELDEF